MDTPTPAGGKPAPVAPSPIPADGAGGHQYESFARGCLPWIIACIVLAVGLVALVIRFGNF